MSDSPPSLEELAPLARSEALGDRAFANGVLRVRYARFPEERPRIAAAYAEARVASLAAQEKTRAGIRDGALRGAAFRSALEAQLPSLRDAWVEEVLDLAFPPLEEPVLEAHLTPYIASGVAEVLHALELTGLSAAQRLVDVGAGLGKVVLLASVLTGARCHGVELDAALSAEAERSAAALGLERATFTLGDAREAELPAAEVYYLFSPFGGEVLDAVMGRIEQLRPRFVCASPVDLRRHPWLEPVGPSRAWLQVHRRRDARP